MTVDAGVRKGSRADVVLSSATTILPFHLYSGLVWSCAGEDPLANVKGSTTAMINSLQAEMKQVV